MGYPQLVLFVWFIGMYKASVLKDINVARCNVIWQNVEFEGCKTCLYALHHLPILRFVEVNL